MGVRECTFARGNKKTKEKGSILEQSQWLILTRSKVCYLMKVMLHHSALSFSPSTTVHVNVVGLFSVTDSRAQKQAVEAAVRLLPLQNLFEDSSLYS